MSRPVAKRRKADDGLRAIIRQHLVSGFMWTTIETGMTQLGVPDTNYLTDEGVEGWIECKATDANAVKFQPGQPAWLDRRARYGGLAFVAVRQRHDGGPRLGDPVDRLLIVAAQHVISLSRGGLAAVPHWHLGSGGPARWDWDFARMVLRRPPGRPLPYNT